MLRVLTISTLFPDASRPEFGIFVERQTRALAAQPGTEVRVVAPVGLPPWPVRLGGRHASLARLPRHEHWRGLDVRRPRFLAVPGTAGQFHVRALIHALTPMLDEVRRDFPFDVIDASFFFPDGPAAVALGRRYGVPVSIKARGADVHYWGGARATAGQVRSAALAANGLLAVSAAMRADLAALGVPAERVRVHHTGVELDRFAPGDRQALKAAQGVTGPLVVSLGALIPRKGHDVVIEAVAKLPGVTLLIAGQGPERARLEALASGLGIADRVRLLGPVRQADLPRLLAAADVMALASASEGLANAWVEALACGTPVVITAAGGAREVVTAPEHGRIAVREPAAFAAAIGALLADPPAPAAVRSGAERFTWDANGTGLRDHLAGLVSARENGDGQAIG